MNTFKVCDKNLMNTLSIKSEIGIKEEPLETHEEYLSENDMKFEFGNQLKEASEIITDVLHLEKPCGSNCGKIEVKHEDTFIEVHDGIIEEDNDYEFKADIDVKNEDIEDLMEDGSFNLNDVILKRNFGAKEGEITNERNKKDILDSFSSISSKLGNGTANIIELKKEERENEEIKEFESRKRFKLDAKFECSLCDYKTNFIRDLQSHSLLVHSISNLYKCLECDYECNEKYSLESHLLTHSNTKLFKCSECDFENNRKSDMKIHLLTHSNTKLFKCSECDYENNRKSDLKRHLLTHSNTKLFKCSECDYENNHKNDMKTHILTHSNTKLFKCSECDYGCNSKRMLKNHLLTHSNGIDA